MKRTVFIFILIFLITYSPNFALNAAAGAYNPEIYNIQKKLKELGYSPGPLDGIFGGGTYEALKKFQKNNKLPETGILDSKTNNLLGLKISTKTISKTQNWPWSTYYQNRLADRIASEMRANTSANYSESGDSKNKSELYSQELQKSKDTTPPEIILNRGIKIVTKARKIISGKAIDKSGVAIVGVNGREAKLDEKGNFSATILLKPGKNHVLITALDIYENQATKTIVIERRSGKISKETTVETIKTGKYYAILIAVEDYKSSTISDLNQPVQDANQIKSVLTNYYTFDSDNILFLKNPNRDKIIDTFDQLSQKITKDDNLLIFYAGHGYWDKRFRQGYWLPSNALKNSSSKWLSNSTIRDYIRGIPTKHTLLVSDACFSGGIFKTRTAFNDAPPAISELYKLPSRKAMTSGILTEVPDKSVFIEYFVKRLRDNKNKYLSSEQLFIKFKNAVINNSPLRQVPQYGEIRESGDEGGDFIFVHRKN